MRAGHLTFRALVGLLGVNFHAPSSCLHLMRHRVYSYVTGCSLTDLSYLTFYGFRRVLLCSHRLLRRQLHGVDPSYVLCSVRKLDFCLAFARTSTDCPSLFCTPADWPSMISTTMDCPSFFCTLPDCPSRISTPAECPYLFCTPADCPILFSSPADCSSLFSTLADCPSLFFHTSGLPLLDFHACGISLLDFHTAYCPSMIPSSSSTPVRPTPVAVCCFWWLASRNDFVETSKGDGLSSLLYLEAACVSFCLA